MDSLSHRCRRGLGALAVLAAAAATVGTEKTKTPPMWRVCGEARQIESFGGSTTTRHVTAVVSAQALPSAPIEAGELEASFQADVRADSEAGLDATVELKLTPVAPTRGSTQSGTATVADLEAVDIREPFAECEPEQRCQREYEVQVSADSDEPLELFVGGCIEGPGMEEPPDGAHMEVTLDE